MLSKWFSRGTEAASADRVKACAPGGSRGHKAREANVERFVQSYGDLLFDLCESVLWSPTNAQLAFRAIVKELAHAPSESTQSYKTYERSWVLRTACENLRHMAPRHGRKVTATEQLELDASPSSKARLERFDVYFHRLPVDDKIVLLLRDKYGLPYPEIANSMGIPVESLKAKRQLAMRALENWIWSTE